MKLLMLKLLKSLHIISKKKYKLKSQVELVKGSELFDTKWYLSQYPQVKAKKVGAAKHYVKHGWQEGKNPSPFFDGNAYLEKYPDVVSKKMCPLVHYLKRGRKEGCQYVGLNGVANVPMVKKQSLGARILYALEYPIRLQDECKQLKSEIKRLKKGLK